uniref:Uncharacterized protein n=1 Tax=Cucumis sativus TaxID=3659 RepID=A0A0A0LSL0_CUCSA
MFLIAKIRCFLRVELSDLVKVERLRAKVKQSPSKSMLIAFTPSWNALVSGRLLGIQILMSKLQLQHALVK